MGVDERADSLDAGRIRLDRRGRQLLVDGQVQKLGGRAFDLLLALVDRRDRVVSKQELLDVVWPGLVVEENNLQVQVVTLRRLLGAQAIATVSGRGYRLSLPVDGRPASGAGLPSETSVADGLLGRDELVRQAAALLARPGLRLLTFSGPGGAGKTRLALRVAAERSALMADGAYVVMLAPVRESGQIAAAVAAALGVRESGAASLDALVQGFLATRTLLLVLDNLEHLPGAALQVAKWLAACPGLQVVTTSRMLLSLAEEQVIEVPPLALPAADTPRDWRGSPAVRLFYARAQSLGRELPDNDETLHAAVRICQRLDGLPLAIELAAARLRLLTPQALAARLQQALPLLAAHRADVPPRQQTLRATIAWSHELLDDATREVFARLAVFVGGWSLDAAEAVNDRPPVEVLDALQALLSMHLVQRVDDVGDEPRYTMLETVREFALECLEAEGQGAGARRQHAAFFLALAERCEPLITSPRRAEALLRLRAEANNFRAALAELIHRQPEPDAALRLVAALAWVWYFDGRYHEGRQWIDAATKMADAERQTRALAAALSGEARLAAYSASFADARDRVDRSAALWRSLGDTRGLAWVLILDGVVGIQSGDAARSERSLSEALAIFQDLRDLWGIAQAMSYLGSVHAVQPGRESLARPLLLEGRARFQALGDPWGVTISSHYLGSIALRSGQFDEARQLTEEMLANATELGDPFRMARNLHQLAEIGAAQGRRAEALDQLGRSMRMNLEHHRLGDYSQQLRLAARLAEDLGRLDAAAFLAGAAEPHAGADRSMPPDDLQPHQARLARLREQLGAEAFEQAGLLGRTADTGRVLALLVEMAR